VQVLSFTTATIVLATQTWWPVLPLILRARGAGVVDVSLAYALLSVASSLPQLWSGRLSDRYGRRPMIALPTFVAAACYAFFAMPMSWQTGVAILVFLSLSQGVQGQSFTVLLAESVPARERSHAFALFQFWVGVASVLGPLVGGLLLPRVGTAALVAASAVVSLGVAIARQRGLAETLGEGASRPFSLAVLFRGRPFLLLVAAVAMQAAINLSLNGPFPALYLGRVRHLGEAAVNLLFGVGTLPGVVASIAIGRAIARVGSVRTTALALVLHFALLMAWLAARGAWATDVGFALLYFFYQAAMIAFSVVRSDVGEEVGLGPVLGAVGLASGLVGAAALPVGGALATALGPGAPFAAGALLSLVAVLTLFRLERAATVPGHVTA
jgi:DHA1 family bicyclomycin/chloramphenicol resistance-like MFS transporter